MGFGYIISLITRPIVRVWRDLTRIAVWVSQAPGRFFRRRFSGDGSSLQLLAWPFVAFASLLMLPAKILRAGDTERNWHFVAGLPALLVLFGFLSAIGYASLRQDSIENRYRARGRAAIAEQDFRSAKTFYGRLVNGGSDDREDLFHWALALAETGDVQRAESILDRLAPAAGEGVGIAIAHRYRAIAQIAAITRNKSSADPRRLENIRWHLEHSGDGRAGDVDEAWALYYWATGQADLASPYFLRAATSRPEYYLVAAEIQKERQNYFAESEILEKAESVFSGLLARDNLDSRARGLLAKTLLARGEIENAQRVLVKGVNLKPTLEMRGALADLLLERHDLAVQENKAFELQLEYLENSLTLNPNNKPAYERLIGLRERVQINEETDRETKSKILKDYLQESIAHGESTALAHFALSNVLWMDENFSDAKFHLTQAYQQDKRFSVIANNLAWVLANEDPPNLDRAYELATSIVAREPDDPRFHDTLGTVLLYQEKYEDALVHLEKALDLASEKKPVPEKAIHERLATVYSKLTKPEMARIHARLAKSDGI